MPDYKADSKMCEAPTGQTRTYRWETFTVNDDLLVFYASGSNTVAGLRYRGAGISRWCWQVMREC